MNKDRVDLSAQRLIKDEYVYDEEPLFFAPALADTPVTSGTQSARRVLCTADATPFVLPPGAVITGVRVVPFPPKFNPLYLGHLTDAERTAVENKNPQITFTRNTDTATFAAGGGRDNPIKIFAPTEPNGGPDTMGTVTDRFVVGLTQSVIGAATHYEVYGEGAIITNTVGGETDALGMVRAATTIYPHGNNAALSDAVINAPCVLVGVFANTDNSKLAADVALVVRYRVSRTSFSTTIFPPYMGNEAPVPT
jgi:hypothetical protein